MTDEPSGDRRADLEKRLAEVRAELADLAQERLRFIVGDTSVLRERSEELESEADGIRRQLGLPPAVGRPARRDGLGWTIVCLSAVVIVVALWMLVQ
ncbi:hypothetical protein [Microbacterium sp. H83]|uniref:hypothetical protein n=1 Tax=Microbacterium sp. H83 TaxID=1827324 RepID=UPI0007F52706|nr:hypothetical protein [Microbacterium sp. H83]OAN34000.1 hypothetical protein A4X16_05995 [Microbacterium sp. H83]